MCEEMSKVLLFFLLSQNYIFQYKQRYRVKTRSGLVQDKDRAIEHKSQKPNLPFVWCRQTTFPIFVKERV